jgi:hypothetical protein
VSDFSLYLLPRVPHLALRPQPSPLKLVPEDKAAPLRGRLTLLSTCFRVHLIALCTHRHFSTILGLRQLHAKFSGASFHILSSQPCIRQSLTSPRSTKHCLRMSQLLSRCRKIAVTMSTNYCLCTDQLLSLCRPITVPMSTNYCLCADQLLSSCRPITVSVPTNYCLCADQLLPLCRPITVSVADQLLSPCRPITVSVPTSCCPHVDQLLSPCQPITAPMSPKLVREC